MAGYLGNTQKISGSYTVDEFTSSGGTTYTLTKTPGAKNNIQVSAGGLVQYPSAYSVSGTTLTLSGVPSGQKVVVRHMGDTIPYPTLADDAVTSAKIANDAVTGAKLNPALVAGDVIYADGTDTINRLAKGTAAQVLTMNAGATAPEWAAAAGGVDGITSSANTTAMTISADEEINMPLQPVFAHTTASTSDNQDVTGDGTLHTILFNTQKFDIGSNTNANGVFTAPITGVYLFGYHLEIVDGTHNKDYDYIYLDTGGFDPGSQHHFSSVSIDLHERVQMTFLVQMTAGWTAIPRIARHSGTKDSDIRGGSSHFWGVLIA